MQTLPMFGKTKTSCGAQSLMLVLTLLTSSGVVASAPKAEVQLQSASESHQHVSVQPPPAVLQLILSADSEPAKLDAKLLEQCRSAQGLSKSELGKFFIVSTLDLNSDGQLDYFVRPAIKPFCSAYYGAHLFRYWFVLTQQHAGVSSYQLIIASGADQVRVLKQPQAVAPDHALKQPQAVAPDQAPSQVRLGDSSGWHDIETSDHTAFSNTTVLWRMRAGKCSALSCRISEADLNGKLTTKACAALPDQALGESVY